MKKLITAVFLLFSASFIHAGENPLVEEMMILDRVFCEVVSAVSLGDGERAQKALEGMHGTMERTHEGVQKGTVKIPKNAHLKEQFVKMDIRYHEKLETLARAAHANDQKRMLSLTKELLSGCVECHGIYRK